MCWFLPDDTTQTDPANPNSLNWAAATAASPGNRISATLYPLYSDVSCEIDPANPSFLYFNSPANLSGALTNVAPVRGFFPTVGPLPSPTGTLPGAYTEPQPLGYIPPAGVQVESVPEVRGDDILVSDVTSFTVRILYETAPVAGGPLPTPFAPQFQPLTGGTVFDTNNPVLGAGGLVYNPPAYRIRALEITIRIWDVKSQQSRQVTVIQDM